ncbi:hypothetical protein E3N88_46149 [Mikania micrantha]|uniref:Uncharacterized protein n=1 Tax=Mikania micrantha TaxID=192012 RepID=A0A5N6L710_9ASTR|nr:hypothetical protein E3N88_46149 [Mikania micrantha]
MADSNSNANRSAARPTGTDDLAAESRRRIDDIVAQVDAEMDRRARDAARARHWGWLPTIIQGWIIGERVCNISAGTVSGTVIVTVREHEFTDISEKSVQNNDS